MPTTLITTPTFGRFSDEPWRVLREAGEAVLACESGVLPADELRDRVAGADALVVGLDAITAEVLDAAPRLKVVAKHGVGVDNIDLAAARERGVRVTFAPGSNSRAVAELAFGLLLDAARRITRTHTEVLAGAWPKHFGPELAGRTLAVIGFGRIGRLVAGFAQAFGMTVVAYDPFLPEAEFAERGVRPLDLAACLAGADFVSLHMPGGSGPPLLDRAALSAMKPGACLVNTARGDLVDEHALAELLHSGHVGAAALDAFDPEPLRADSPLRSAPNTVLTSHIGACSHEANRDMGLTVARDVVRVLRGEEPLHPVG
ncbi:phosphoglycerate dehydrogenase [Streptomonospora nanhaiensis]|uniref:D-3-phosphoglycerate dehydrogenase n=1 Tax=Streptomonospora nanhaiensis TaxID=1323731 RepID=A0A853BJJ2_9ACTN|nr:phosphoglycerate dehydrogenase [Streptomonospora nanhaiensis]MBX9391509.1 phosphoglycerate dehydrogenase [Streptomonospora nanhaiensis]NYI95200.1 D-3-phosphoglycerate dehydrogenase [Streptomonospora nanhaiensis]